MGARRSSRVAALTLAMVLVVAACTDSDTTATTTIAPTTTAPTTTAATAGTATTTTTTRPPPELPTFADDDDEIDTDEAVRIGVLDNGLTYYIRENRAPGGRAQLRLAVRAGSIQEAEDQRGAAHYLEHMMFNGTERFPANELVLVLQRFGAEFGADINAYTSYEETVYELELPTDDAATIAAGFDVLFEWATAVALDPAEVDLERGVLVEEWRLRDQGFWGRYFVGVTERLLAETPYEDHEPLGTPEEVAATTPEGLRHFFETWYRTDTMAIVAVGDFDADVIEQLIFERFNAVDAATDPEPVPEPATSAAERPTFFILTDPEFPQAWAELNYPLPVIPGPGSVGSVRQSMALDLAWDMIVTRLAEETLRGDVPFFDPSFAANPLVRAQRTPGLAAFAHPEDLAVTTEALLAEVQRARAHGFTEGEMERAIDDMRGGVELEFDERGTTQDAAYAGRYVEHFLGDVPIPSAEDWHDLRLRLLDEVTANQVWDTFAATIASTAPFVIIVAPEALAGLIPDKDGLAEIVERVATTDYEPFTDDATALETLMERPDTTLVNSRGQFSDTGLTELTLANGSRVVFLVTTIRDDVVVFRASSPGGWATLPPGDVVEAQMISDVVLKSGVGDIDQVTLERTLSGLIVSLAPFIDEVHEGFFGEAATQDLETLLQLVHLYMTEPRFEQTALDIAIGETLPFAANPDQVPDLAVSAAVAEERFSGDARFGVLPTEDDLTTFDLEQAAELFVDRFDDPGDFVFVFAGDFDQDEVEDLARRYLGSIPGPGDTEPFVNVRPDPPDGVIERVVEAGTGQLGGVTFLFSNPITLDPDTRIEIDLLDLVIQQRLTERIREELSASYSPFALVELVEEPEQSVEFRIQISGDPDGLDEVVEQTLAVLADLRDNGPTEDELAIAAEQLLRDYELVSNELLSQAIVFSAEHPDEFLSEIIARIDRTFDPTRQDIRDLARALLPGDDYILVKLVPIGFEG
ncbi:MAG: insulinase family protein [Acidimicrobiia bacterium]